MNDKIKYGLVSLTIILLSIGLYLYLKEKKRESNGQIENIVSFEEKLLAVLPPDITGEDLNKHLFSPDGRSVAYILKKGNRLSVVLNGSIGPDYDDVGPPHFSPDGKLIAYKAKEDGSWYLIKGKEKSEKFDDIDYPLFSSDGIRFAYGAKAQDKWFIVIDNQKGKEYDKVEALSFSPDGKRFAYRGNMEADKKSVIVIDGEQGPEYDWVTEPQFSPDGKRAAYTGKEGDKWFMIIDGKKSEKYDAVGTPVFSPDSKRIAYAVRDADKSFIIIDDKKSEKYDGVWNPCFSPDGKRVAYCAKEGNEWCIVVDDKKGEQYEDLSSGDPSLLILSRIRQGMPANIPFSNPCFSPDSKSLCYWVKEGNQSFMIIDGKKSRLYDEVSIPYFSPDGKSAAYGVKEGENWFIVAGNERFSAFYGILPKEIPVDEYRIKVARENVIVFSTSQKKVAYICLAAKGYCLAVNGKIVGEYDLIGGAVVNNGLGIVFRIEPSGGKLMLTGVEHIGTSVLTFGNEYRGAPYLYISPDGKKVSFGARKGRELWWKVINME